MPCEARRDRCAIRSMLDIPTRKILLKPDGTVDRVVVPSGYAHRLIEEVHDPGQCRRGEMLEKKSLPPYLSGAR